MPSPRSKFQEHFVPRCFYRASSFLNAAAAAAAAISDDVFSALLETTNRLIHKKLYGFIQFGTKEALVAITHTRLFSLLVLA
mmetsp:Transcript_25826/g.41208  ORF Transcript_25826/g.41208 Transcript_25826/m.41208 type:complete len:82 (-) Transcript_25826:60-305(-)